MAGSSSFGAAKASDLAVARPEVHLRIQAVTVFVRDQERSLRFYLDQLGFSLAFDVHLPSGDRWLAVSPPDGTGMISLAVPGADKDADKLIGRATQISFFTDNFS